MHQRSKLFLPLYFFSLLIASGNPSGNTNPPAPNSYVMTDEVPVSPDECHRLNHEAKEKFDALLAERLLGADAVAVTSLIPSRGNGPTEATIADQHTVSTLIAHIKAKESAELWSKCKLNGEETVVRVFIPCQCDGDFLISFYKKGALLESFSVHHRTHVRSAVLTGNSDINLEENSIDRLYGIASTLLPNIKQLARPLNHPPEPTPSTVH